MSVAIYCLSILCFLLIGYILKIKKSIRKVEDDFNNLHSSIHERVKIERATAIKQSKAVIKGQVGENFAPYLPGFAFEPSECSFLGKPVDFIIFSGLASGEVKEIIIMDIKTGAASLTKTQREIRDCIKAGKVRFEKFNLP